MAGGEGSFLTVRVVGTFDSGVLFLHFLSGIFTCLDFALDDADDFTNDSSCLFRIRSEVCGII